MTDDTTTAMSCTAEHCITCSDEGIEMTVVRTDGALGLALCEQADGARVTVQTLLVEPVVPGDRLLVHAGTAIAAVGVDA